MTRRSSRNDIIDWWQAVLDETKDFVDDRIDGCLSQHDEKLADDIGELKRAIAELNTKLDRNASGK